MGGGLMQLVAYGAQDVYLTGNPQITFFKVVYRRHTNFAMESIEQTFNGTSDFGKRVTATISRNGDLISNCILEVTVPELCSKTSAIAQTDGAGLLTGPGGETSFPVTLVTTSGTTVTDDTIAAAALTAWVADDDGESANNREAIHCAINRGHARWVKYLGHFLIKSVEVEIGGQRVDKHYGHWLQVWHELTRNCCQDDCYNKMIGNVTELTNPGSLLKLENKAPYTPVEASSSTNCVWEDDNATIVGERGTAVDVAKVGCVAENTLYIPLQFWFNRNPGLALPLIALQYHEVKINFDFESIENLTLGVLKTDCCRSMQKCSLYVDYIYLDTDERRRFAQVSHEYLIEQLQFTGDESLSKTSAKVRLNFNHPVKELIWTCTSSQTSTVTSHHYGIKSDGTADTWDIDYAAPKDYTNYTTNAATGGGDNPTKNGKLQLNGHDRFSERKGSYFNCVQPWQHHSNSPAAGINVYSFAVKPEEHQPSGTCNFSRIDNATLILTINGLDNSNTTASGAKTVAYTLRVYAVNYNVLRIMSGMGGLAYSN